MTGRAKRSDPERDAPWRRKNWHLFLPDPLDLGREIARAAPRMSVGRFAGILAWSLPSICNSLRAGAEAIRDGDLFFDIAPWLAQVRYDAVMEFRRIGRSRRLRPTDHLWQLLPDADTS
ncbi:hypothetical protein BKE38_04040 [Pseudoroseomonas deserti]|uniref:Uncharacterized protein n=1 Tax=Teichococcus deserti TaxID=1817963 RepID=A0A1V2H8I2_9PROT|nr:hypothetical protein [Pseudoroseomonas deserti]ONG57330.1 hypothetical protein BKE38_04040 [Pseudoroseomonas deserti]